MTRATAGKPTKPAYYMSIFERGIDPGTFVLRKSTTSRLTLFLRQTLTTLSSVMLTRRCLTLGLPWRKCWNTKYESGREFANSPALLVLTEKWEERYG